MKIFSKNIVDGQIDKNMGHFSQQLLNGRKPNRSLHLAWRDLPKNTQSLAIIFVDHDAIPVCGFSWIHWTVANIDPKLGQLPENASVDMDLLEGVTSWASGLLSEGHKLAVNDAIGFGGCMPPDKPHTYTLKVYALDTKLDLTRGFYMNELIHAMEGHILAKSSINGIYFNK